jgi:hypothetical protein
MFGNIFGWQYLSRTSNSIMYNVIFEVHYDIQSVKLMNEMIMISLPWQLQSSLIVAAGGSGIP